MKNNLTDIATTNINNNLNNGSNLKVIKKISKLCAQTLELLYIPQTKFRHEIQANGEDGYLPFINPFSLMATGVGTAINAAVSIPILKNYTSLPESHPIISSAIVLAPVITGVTSGIYEFIRHQKRIYQGLSVSI